MILSPLRGSIGVTKTPLSTVICAASQRLSSWDWDSALGCHPNYSVLYLYHQFTLNPSWSTQFTILEFFVGWFGRLHSSSSSSVEKAASVRNMGSVFTVTIPAPTSDSPIPRAPKADFLQIRPTSHALFSSSSSCLLLPFGSESWRICQSSK